MSKRYCFYNQSQHGLLCPPVPGDIFWETFGTQSYPQINSDLFGDVEMAYYILSQRVYVNYIQSVTIEIMCLI